MIQFAKILTIFLLVGVSFGKKSFTILLDTTLSMEDEIKEIKKNIGSVVNHMNLSDVENFILVPFNDPDVGPPIFTSTQSDLITALNTVTVHGGHDCPENSLAGINKALEVSNIGSQIFVFTDAYAKDPSKLSDLQNLCLNTRSQVIIFLTGKCLPILPERGRSTNVDVYYRIARYCGGVFFMLDPVNLQMAFNFMKMVTNTAWDEIATQAIFRDFKNIEFSVDSSDQEVMIAVYGKSPSTEVVDKDHKEIRMNKEINTPNFEIIRLQDPLPGKHHIIVRSQGVASVTFYRKKTDFFPYLYGFSTRLPHSWSETSLRPLPGCTNYINVASNGTLEPNILELSEVGTDDKRVLQLQRNENQLQFYYVRNYFQPNTSFRVTITGQDISNRKTKTQSTIIIQTQWKEEDQGLITREQPKVELLEVQNLLVDYEGSVDLACKVTAYPKPTITWKDDEGITYTAEDILLEIPNVRVSYVTIDNLGKNKTIECKAANELGEDSRTVEVFVKRNAFIEVIQSPKDQFAEYGSEVKLFCEAESYPEASITWYHNNTKIYSSFNNNIDLGTFDHSLIIKHVNLEDCGEYTCEIKNEVEAKTFTATVGVFGLEGPKVQTTREEITLKPGEWNEIECFASGKPKPDITWQYKSENEGVWGSVPNGVYIEEGKLKIATFKTEYSGVFRCEALNVIGQDYRDIIVKSQYEPTIKGMADEVTVKEGDIVELKCEVDAMPPARVRWELTQDDVIMPFDSRHVTDGNNTHRFEAYWKDSGNYHCIAENSVGRAEKILKVNVLVAPYIQSPEFKTVSARTGSTISFICNVQFGNPMPSTKWEFMSTNSTSIILLRGKTSTTLTIRNVTKNNEGTYTCLADNDVGSDSIKISLKVQ